MQNGMSLFALLLGVAWMQVPAIAVAAEGYDSCAGFIDSLPATIGQQGTWCLRKDLSTAMASGHAITIAANNVTLDCNGFKLGGLAAGAASMARGVHALDRINVTVRNCTIRGFFEGIGLLGTGGGGHRVEDNLLDQNLVAGIYLQGDGNLVQRNRIADTGGSDVAPGLAWGIVGTADMLDNAIDGVSATGEFAGAWGIQASGAGNEVRGNRVRRVIAGLMPGAEAVGIEALSGGMTLDRNRVHTLAGLPGTGILASGAKSSCTYNVVVDFELGYFGCERTLGNLEQ